MLPKFGNVLKPREGKRLGVLSTRLRAGVRRRARASPSATTSSSTTGDTTNGKDWGDHAAPLPDGLPEGRGGCAQATDVHDVIDLEARR